MKEHIKGVRDEVLSVKSEMVSIRATVDKIESTQNHMKGRLDELEERIGNTQYDHDVLVSDIGSMSMHHEQHEECLDSIEQQLNIIESNRLKNVMRIFGLPETESNESELKSLIKEKVLNNAANEETFDDDTIMSARRIGVNNQQLNHDYNNPARMVIVEFTRSKDKFTLFKYRDKLRESGIRLANDLTYIQRKQLKDARDKGLNGYFKNGKLHTYVKPSSTTAGIATRVFRRALRPTERLQDISEQNREGAMEVNHQVEVENVSNTTGVSAHVD